MNLFVDTETSGLLRRDVGLGDVSQPWIREIALDLCDAELNTVDFFKTRILAEGRKIKPDAEAVHGMTSREADRTGISEIVAIGVLAGFVAQAKVIVGHGLMGFDALVIEGVLQRKGKATKLFRRHGLEIRDTMLTATTFCHVEPKPPRDDGQYKWPSLDEACEKLLGESVREGHHSAWEDCQRCKRVYRWLLEHNAFEELA